MSASFWQDAWRKRSLFTIGRTTGKGACLVALDMESHNLETATKKPLSCIPTQRANQGSGTKRRASAKEQSLGKLIWKNALLQILWAWSV